MYTHSNIVLCCQSCVAYCKIRGQFLSSFVLEVRRVALTGVKFGVVIEELTYGRRLMVDSFAPYFTLTGAGMGLTGAGVGLWAPKLYILRNFEI